MTKKGATILACATTFFYFVVCIIVMLVYKGESAVIATGDQFKIFLLVQAPRIIFLFGLTVFLLVLSALPIEKKGKNSKTATTTKTATGTKPETTTTKTATVSKPKTVKVVVKKVNPTEEETEETDGE